METSGHEYTVGEEIASSVTHGLGVLLGVSAMTLLVYRSVLYGTAWHVVVAVVYGVTLLMLYAASTLYHAIPSVRAKRALKVCDHMAIYFLIAGTYTPYALITLRPVDPVTGWTIFGVVWGCAVAGCVFKLFFTGRLRMVSTLFYLGMGWIAVFAIRPLLQNLPAPGFVWLVAGGLCYTFGAVFYMIKRVRYFHAVWHLFVLGGSACHFFSVFFYVLAGPAAAGAP